MQFAFPAAAEEARPAGDKPKVTYEEHVKPIFREHCFSCHNQNQAKSDLALDSFSALMQGGASGEVVVAGDLDNSRLWHLVAHLDTPEMPPEQDKLPEAKLAIIKNWITGGALENSGSVAKVVNKPKMELALPAGSRKPEGPPPMPEGLPKHAVVHTTRPGAATAIAASPWAPLVALAGQKQVLLYHADTSELLGVLPFPEGVPHVLKFSRSGTLLLAGGGRGAHSGKVVVYDVRTGERVFEVGDELDVVLAADINENHTRIALGGPGRIVRIYSTQDGSLLHEIRKHTDWIYAIEFSPDGVLLATADRSNGMFIWEAETAREYQNLRGHNAAITDVSWRADSNVLASSSEDGTIKLWEMNGGNQIKSWNAHGGGAASVEFAHDGRLASVGRDRQAKLWDQNGQALKAFEPFADLGLEVALTHDGRRVVAGDWTGEIRVYGVEEGKQIAALSSNPPTLEMLAAAEREKAAAAQAAAEKAAAELAGAQKALEEKLAALEAATGRTAAAQSAVDSANQENAAAMKAAAEKAAAEKAATEKAAAEAEAAAKALAEKAEAERILAEKAAAAKAAAEKQAAAAAALKAAAAEKQAAEKSAAEKAAAVKAAADKLAAEKAAAEKLAAEKAAAEKLLAEKQAAAKAAQEAAAAAAAAAKAAQEALAKENSATAQANTPQAKQ